MRRAVTVVLWFMAGWGGGSVLAYVAGLSPIVAPLLGLAAAGLVAWDPTGALWGRNPDRKRIARRLADLERVPASGTDEGPDTALEPAAD